MADRTGRFGTTVLALGITLVGAGGAGAQQDLTDAEVAHVAVTANAIDVEMAELAPGRTQNTAILEFARTMIRDHTAVNEGAVALAGRLGVTPADNAVSQSLLEGAAGARGEIEGLTGSGFDRAYIAREVGYHQAVLDALDGLLIPTTENAELRALLEEVRPAIAAHLEHARRLQAELEGDHGGRLHTVEIRGFEYHPEHLAVARGDTVVWVNRDRVPHTATKSDSWDSGELAEGARWRTVASTPAAGDYYCTLHPSMRGALTVR